MRRCLCNGTRNMLRCSGFHGRLQFGVKHLLWPKETKAYPTTPKLYTPQNCSYSNLFILFIQRLFGCDNCMSVMGMLKMEACCRCLCNTSSPSAGPAAHTYPHVWRDFCPTICLYRELGRGCHKCFVLLAVERKA